MTVVAVEPVTAAVLAAVDGASKWPVGDHEAPSVTTDAYSLVYLVAGGALDGSLANPHEMATLVFQVTSVGRVRGQCQHLADLNRRAMLDGKTTIVAAVRPSWRCMYVNQRIVGGPILEGRDDTGRDVWTCVDLFEVQVTPSSV